MAQTQISLRVGALVLYKSNLHRVIGLGIGGARGGRVMLQRKDERGLKVGVLAWATDVASVEPATLRASTAGEAPRRRGPRPASFDLQDQRTPADAHAAHREGRASRAGR